MAEDKSQIGIRCPRCGCADFTDQQGRPWDTVKTVNLPGFVRRYKICRYCGHRVRTKKTPVRYTRIRCPGCGSPHAPVYDSSHLPIRYHKCADCGLRFKSVEG